MSAARSLDALHAIYKVGREKLLDNAVGEGRVCCDAFADVGAGGEEVEEAEGSREVVLRQGGIVEGRVIAGLVFEENGEVLRGNLGHHVVLGRSGRVLKRADLVG